MSSIENLSHLGSSLLHTLRRGSITERVVLGTTFAIAGLLIAEKIFHWAARFFSKPSRINPADLQVPVNPQVLDDYIKQLEAQIEAHKPPAPPQPAPVPELKTRTLLKSLSIRSQPLTEEQKPKLAKALQTYHELKKEIDGGEERFIFITKKYCEHKQLPPKLIWKEKNVEIDIPERLNDTFRTLDEELRLVNLSLKDVNPIQETSSSKEEKEVQTFFAVAEFQDGSTKTLQSLTELYQTVDLQSPDILGPLKIESMKKEIKKAKETLHQSRINIIEKTLSTLRAVFIDQFLNTFPEKYKEIYTLVGSDPEALRFVVENICWHALDRALESVEVTFVPTEEAQQKYQQLDLTNLLKKGIPEEDKRKEAEGFLLEILKDPNNRQAMESLVKLLLKEPNPDREALAKRVQAPKLQLEEERIQQELGRLETIQTFFKTVLFSVGVMEQGKTALLGQHVEGSKKEGIRVTPLSQPVTPSKPASNSQETYAQEAKKVSEAVTQAGERAIKNVADQQWISAINSMNQQVEQLVQSSGITREAVVQIIQQGWTQAPNKQRFLELKGPDRWLLTKAMLHAKLDTPSLQKNGDKVVHEVGKWISSFIETLYGRLTVALLAFEKRTLEVPSQDIKPADRIAEAFIDSLLKSYKALQKVKETKSEAGHRELAIVKELGKTRAMHPSAAHKQNSDAIFLGKLLIELLPVLQPEGLSGDLKKILSTELSRPAEADPTLLQKIIEKYKATVLPKAEPWVQLAGSFIIQALQHIIERQSAYNIADQLSEVLSPVNINHQLVELLIEDTSLSVQEESKAPIKWTMSDELRLRQFQNERSLLKEKINICEKTISKLREEKRDIKEIDQEFIQLKKATFKNDTELALKLLKRVVIANIDDDYRSYAWELVQDLFELLQYPQLIRNIVFPVLEKTVQTLAQPLDDSQNPVHLDLPTNQRNDQPLFNFLFSNTLKTTFGNRLLSLVSSVSTTNWTFWGSVTQFAAQTVVPGYFVFSKLQAKVEELIQKKFNDKEAINWSVAKLVLTADAQIIQFANDPSDQGMSGVIAHQLNKALGSNTP